MIKENKKSLMDVFFIIIGFVLWAWLFRDFYSGRLRLYPDGWAYYDIVKKYFDSMSIGVYPLWNPLLNWGLTDTENWRFIAEFNPILLGFLIIYKLGAPFTPVYFGFMLFYYFLGLFGFYLLSKEFFKNSQWALISYFLLLFSNAGLSIFFNACEVMMLVPSIWFFYFLILFHRSFQAKHALAVIFCLMIIMTTYMPFYFLTVFLSIFILYAVFYSKDLMLIIKGYVNFVLKNRAITLLCAVSVLFSVMPGLIWYLDAGKGEFSIAYRQADSTVSNAASVGLSMINLGTIIGPLTVQRLFSGFSFQTNEITYFYLSVFIYPVLMLSVFNKINRRSIILFVVSSVMLLISLTDSTPVHKFLYDHVFYFKLIRNIYYLFYLVMPLIVLFIVEQFRLFLEAAEGRKLKKILVFAAVTAAHGLFFVYLYRLGDVAFVTYLTIAFSYIVFVCFMIGILKEKYFIYAVIATLICQPVYVFCYYAKNAIVLKNSMYSEIKRRPVFSYVRPKPYIDVVVASNVLPEDSGITNNYKYYGVAVSRMLLRNVRHEILEKYTQHKFVVYDFVRPVDEAHMPWHEIEYYFDHNYNAAFISDNQAADMPVNDVASRKTHPIKIKEAMPEIKVTAFGLNFIEFETNFDAPKFVVYNDSYHSGWQALVNGRKAEIVRANVAFKGLWLPEGKNTVFMRFRSIWLHAFYWFLVGYFAVFFFFCVRSFNRKENGLSL